MTIQGYSRGRLAHCKKLRKTFKHKSLSLKYFSGAAILPVAWTGRQHRVKIACLGGGPAGLYFAISMKLRDAAHEITVFERNRPDDTFGWGVVFSDETFDNITANDPHQRCDDPFAFRLLGRHRGSLSRAADRFERPRLFRYRAQEAAPVVAGTRVRTGSRACVFRPRSPAPAHLQKITTSSSPRTD